MDFSTNVPYFCGKRKIIKNTLYGIALVSDADLFMIPYVAQICLKSEFGCIKSANAQVRSS